MLGTWRNALLIEKQNTQQSISQPGEDPMKHDYKNHRLVVLRLSSNHACTQYQVFEESQLSTCDGIFIEALVKQSRAFIALN